MTIGHVFSCITGPQVLIVRVIIVLPELKLLDHKITAIRCRVGINYQLTKQEALELK